MCLIDELTKEKNMTTGEIIRYFRAKHKDEYISALESYMSYCELGSRLAIQSALGMETSPYKRYEPIPEEEVATID